MTVHGGSLQGPQAGTASAIEALDNVTLTVLNSDVEGTFANQGASIDIGEDGDLTVDGSRVFDGDVSGDGGNIFAGRGTTVDLIDSVVELGTAQGSGGGIYVEADVPTLRAVTIVDSFVRDNHAQTGVIATLG